jgi:hypothetical protein
MGVVSYGTDGLTYTTDTYPVSGASGTLAGIAPTNAFLRDTITGWTYRNTGTKDIPAWTKLTQPFDEFLRAQFHEDFGGAGDYFWLDVPLFDASGDANKIPTTTTARGQIVVPRSGIVTHAIFVAEDGLATNNTNHVTLTITNKLASGSGSSAVLTAGSANNTTNSTTAGTAITANAPYVLDVVAGSVVNAGDVLLCLATVGGTLGGAIDCPTIKIRVATLSENWTPRVYRTAGKPTVVNNGGLTGLSSYDDGNAYISLSATNEAQYVGMDWGYRNTFLGSAKAVFEARVYIGTNPATNTRICVGLGSPLEPSSSLDPNYFTAASSSYAYDPTNAANIWAWFKLNASLVLTAEAYSVTESNLAQATGVTLTNAKWYTLTIDLRDLTAIRYFVNGLLVATLSAPTLAAGVLSPTFFIAKDSGTNAATLRVAYADVTWNRSF